MKLLTLLALIFMSLSANVFAQDTEEENDPTTTYSYSCQFHSKTLPSFSLYTVHEAPFIYGTLYLTKNESESIQLDDKRLQVEVLKLDKFKNAEIVEISFPERKLVWTIDIINEKLSESRGSKKLSFKGFFCESESW